MQLHVLYHRRPSDISNENKTAGLFKNFRLENFQVHEIYHSWHSEISPMKTATAGLFKKLRSPCVISKVTIRYLQKGKTAGLYKNLRLEIFFKSM